MGLWKSIKNFFSASNPRPSRPTPTASRQVVRRQLNIKPVLPNKEAPPLPKVDWNKVNKQVQAYRKSGNSYNMSSDQFSKIKSVAHDEGMKNPVYRNAIAPMGEFSKAFMQSYAPSKMFDRDKRLEGHIPTTIARGLGTLTSYVAGGESGWLNKGASKLLGTKVGTKAVSKLAGTKAVQNIAKRQLASKGISLTVGNLAKASEKNAKKIVHSVAKEGLQNITTDLVKDSNNAIADGKKLGSKEYFKDLALNAGMAVGVGGLTQGLPLVKALKTPSEKVVQLTGKVKANGLPKTKVVKVPLGQAVNDTRVLVNSRRSVRPLLEQIKAEKLAQKTDDVVSEIKPLKQGIAKLDEVAMKPISDVTPTKRALSSIDTARPLKPIKQAVSESEGVNAVGSMANIGTYRENTQAFDTVKKYYKDNNRVQEILKEIDESGTAGKYMQSNDVSTQKALAEIGDDIKSAENAFISGVHSSNGGSAVEIAKSKILMDNAVKRGDYDTFEKVFIEHIDLMSQNGRNLQAGKLFARLSPQGKAMATEKMIRKLEVEQGLKIERPKDLIMKLADTTDEFNSAKIQDEIRLAIWEQIPATLTEKLTAWRYLSMLGNPKTHIRNIIGNVIFTPVKGIRNIIATGIEKGLIKEGEKSKAILTSKDKDLIELGKKFFEQDSVIGNVSGSKWLEGARPQESTVFKFTPLEWLRKLNSRALEGEDKIFLGFSYRRSFAQYLKANGFTAKTVTDEALGKARQYAMSEALNSTYRDANIAAEYLQKLKRYANMSMKNIPTTTHSPQTERLLKKGAGLFVEAVAPFTKTPLNIMSRGVEYSPIGLMQGLGKLAMAKGDNTQLIKGISRLADGLTGTGLMALGMFAVKSGFVRAGMDTSSKEGRYKSMIGEQPYSITVGDYTYTLDWAAPLALPFFTGAELANDFDTLDLATLLDSTSRITDPMLNLSMVQGLNKILKTGSQAQKDGNVVGEIAQNAAQSFMGQFLPTFGGQLARTIDSLDRDPTSTAENPMTRNWETFGRNMMAKVPFLSQLNPERVDLWGRTNEKESAEDYIKAGLLNFVSPTYIKKKNITETDRQLLDLYERTGDESVLPDKAKKYDLKVDDSISPSGMESNIRITPRELMQYRKTKGAESFMKASAELANNYSKSDDETIKAVKGGYTEAGKKAKKEAFINRGWTDTDYDFTQLSKEKREKFSSVSGVMGKSTFMRGVNTIEGIDGKKKDQRRALALIRSGITDLKQIQALDGSIKEGTYKKAMKMRNAPISVEEIGEHAEKAERTGDNRLSKKELIAYLNQAKLPREKKRLIFAMLGNIKWKNPY